MVGGAFAFGCVLTVLVFGVLWAMRPEPAPVQPATAVLDVIYAPTDTWSAPVSSQVTPTPQVYPSPLPGVIAVVVGVEVSKPDLDRRVVKHGLTVAMRLRSVPGSDAELVAVGIRHDLPGEALHLMVLDV